jgi:release factor glutamine methyltransferase
MQLKDVIQKTTQFFRDKGFESPRLDTELLLAKALQWDRLKLYLNYEYPMSEAELSAARDLVRRRAAGEPVAYILGTKDFYNHTFQVSPAVLIPRPETEELVHAVIEWWTGKHAPREEQDVPHVEAISVPEGDDAGADTTEAEASDSETSESESTEFDANTSRVCRIVDLGTGSGCIGLSLLAEIPEAKLLAVDLSGDALEVAKKNAESFGVFDRVSFVAADAARVDSSKVVESLGGLADVVVANPPYIAEGDPAVQPSVKAFEPAQALYSPEQGLAHIRSWAGTAARLAAPRALVMFEIGYEQGPQARALFEAMNAFESIEIVRDMSGHDRFVRCLKNERSSNG